MKLPPPSLAALLLLVGCPLPQSVPSVPPGSIPPPRIVDDVSAPPAAPSCTLTTAGTTVAFDPNLALPGQTFRIAATIADENYSEPVDYRWFVDYDPAIGVSPPGYLPIQTGQLAPPTAEPYTRRQIPQLPFQPLSYGNTIHVLELVVSNGFETCDTLSASSQPLPCRTPQTTPNSYEVQSYKWVFVPVPNCEGLTPPTCPAACP